MQFNAGKYYVGDPCYVIDDDEWSGLCDTDCFDTNILVLDGQKCFVANTAYGDGSYEDQYGNMYGVDSGLLALIPFEVMQTNPKGDGGKIFDFEHDFFVNEKAGIFQFGRIHIDTN